MRGIGAAERSRHTTVFFDDPEEQQVAVGQHFPTCQTVKGDGQADWQTEDLPGARCMCELSVLLSVFWASDLCG